MADALGPDMGRSTTGSMRGLANRFVTSIVARMPYTYGVVQAAREKNPKFETFHEITARREERLQKLSIFQAQDDMFNKIGSLIDKSYHQFMYADIDVDKIRRLQEYRRMAAYAELSDAIDEICDEAIVKNKQGDIVEFLLKGKYDNSIRESLKHEWKTFINIFNLEEKGWTYIRRLLIEGELYFENLIHKKKSEAGILGIIDIPTELINPVYDNTQNSIITAYMLRRPRYNPKRTMMAKETEELITMEKNQITYVHSGIWNEDHTIRLPYIENARRAYKQLSLIEDSIVIHRLVRAPERLVFYVDVGNASPPKAEAMLKRTMQQYWTRKSYSNGRVTNLYDPQSMLDSFWFAKRSGNDGTKVDRLEGGQNLGALDDLLYFVRKLYKSLKVPQQRIDPADPFKDGQEITREELRFARFIQRVQRQFAAGIKQTFITHLKLRGLWDKLKIKEFEVEIEFSTPTTFQIVRDQQIWQIMWENYNALAQNEYISKTFGQRYYLKWDDAQIAENREWLKKDMALLWELDQIRTQGPNWRDQMAAMDDAMSAETGGMGGGAGGPTALPGGGGEAGGGKTELPPEFSQGPETANMPGATPPAAAAGATPPAPA